MTISSAVPSGAALWWHGARPRTLPAAISPVIVGVGAAVATGLGSFGVQQFLITVLCVVVALALQVGVNYANDYSDGIRGTDEERVGPVRLVGQGLAEPGAVKRAAFASFGVAAIAGLVLVLLSKQWWLLGAGVLAIAAAWFYTGGRRPYGYAGLGELVVFLFFGLVAVTGTAAALAGRVSVLAVVAAIPVGLLAAALLLVNNLRDIVGDEQAGKRTLATRLGEEQTRRLYVSWLWIPYLVAIGITIVGLFVASWPSLPAAVVLTIPLAAAPARAVRNGAHGAELIGVLGSTARLELAFCVLFSLGLAL